MEFKLKKEYGRERYYPTNLMAQALVDLTGRKCLNGQEIGRLRYAGFVIKLDTNENEKENS